MVAKRSSQLAVIILIIFIIIAFLGYSYYADADALLHVYAEVESINNVNVKLSSASITFTMNITNPSTRNINDLSSHFDIYIEQNKIGDGSFSNIDIPADSSILKPVTITVYYNQTISSIWNVIVDKFQGQQSKLIIKGTMTASVIFGLTTASQDFTTQSN
jgi:LEA14-like dessication related protein